MAYGVSDYCGGRATRAAHTFTVCLVGQLAAVALTIVLVAVRGDPVPDAADVTWSLAAGLSSTAGVTAFYHALANGAMTVVAPTTAVISAVVPVVVGVALGERPGPVAVAGIVVAVVAVGLVSGVGGRADRPTPLPILLFAVVGGLGFALLFTFLDRTSDASGVWPLLISQSASVVVLAPLVAARRLPLPPRGAVLGVMMLAGVLSVAANVAYLAATRQGLLSLVAVVTSLYPATTVVLAMAIDGERTARAQQVGLGLVVGALALVAAGAP